MKAKMIAIFLVLAMIMVSFAGCKNAEGNENKTNQEENNNAGENGAEEENDKEQKPSGEDGSTTDNEAEKEEDGAGEAILEGDLTAVIEKIYEKTGFELMVGNTPVDLTNSETMKYNMGLEDASKIKEAVVSEAMISSQAYSLVLARVNDAADAKDVANDMLNGIDQRKWICVIADDLQVVTKDDLVLLVMVSSEMKDTVTSQKLVDAFGEICGADFDEVLTK